MELIHTLLLLIRENSRELDLEMSGRCLGSLEKSAYKTVIIFNQGCLTNEDLAQYLKQFKLDCEIIGSGTNTGTVVGRQGCFEHVYERFPDAEFISELHPDMIFASDWENALIDYLKANEDEPVIGCGIVSDPKITEYYPNDIDTFLAPFKSNRVERGFTLPCVHKTEVLKAVGGYDARFLKGMQAFEDDSLLLAYHYYYGTRANWIPKINYNSVVYHAVGGQRFELSDDLYANFDGLVKKYGAMGLNALANIHVSPWQVDFFSDKFSLMRE
ncbi:MAG TPA: hypothetical protein DEQ02_03510 [Ruminococcaceae bacterium]|nr:hypothetical protein [Oscillospiraceae bacterium]